MLFLPFFSSFAQVDSPTNWQQLEDFSGGEIYYDLNQLAEAKQPQFEAWLLEWHDPALTIEGITDPIVKTQTLYIINSDRERFTIKEVVYYKTPVEISTRYRYLDADGYTQINLIAFEIVEESPLKELLKVKRELDLKKETP